MSENFFDFANSTQALGALSETVIKLETALKSKNQADAKSNKELNALLSQKDNEIEALKTKSANVAQKIDDITRNLDNMLDQNGTSNNNN